MAADRSVGDVWLSPANAGRLDVILPIDIVTYENVGSGLFFSPCRQWLVRRSSCQCRQRRCRGEAGTGQAVGGHRTTLITSISRSGKLTPASSISAHGNERVHA